MGYELDKLLKKAEKFRKEVTKSKESSEKFLKEMGFLTPKGRIAKRYKPICTPQSRA